MLINTSSTHSMCDSSGQREGKKGGQVGKRSRMNVNREEEDENLHDEHVMREFSR